MSASHAGVRLRSCNDGRRGCISYAVSCAARALPAVHVARDKGNFARNWFNFRRLAREIPSSKTFGFPYLCALGFCCEELHCCAGLKREGCGATVSLLAKEGIRGSER